MPWMHCPAKLNLSLHLQGKRTDGFTSLDSWVAKLSLFDTLCLGRANTTLTSEYGAKPLEGNLYFSSNDAYLQNLEHTNLVVRSIYGVQQALQQLNRYTHPWPAVHIHLEKQLPYQAGLGSASSNAATTLRMANQFYSHALEVEPLSLSQLYRLGATLGSDVPLFLVPDAPLIHMQGRGEVIAESLPRLSSALYPLGVIVVKYAGVQVSTPIAFSRLHQRKAYSTANPMLDEVLKLNTSTFEEVAPYLHNGFTSIAQELCPELESVYQAFRATGAAHSLLCGSGSAVAGFYLNGDDLESEYATLKTILPSDAYCVVTRFFRGTEGDQGNLTQKFSFYFNR